MVRNPSFRLKSQTCTRAFATNVKRVPNGRLQSNPVRVASSIRHWMFDAGRWLANMCGIAVHFSSSGRAAPLDLQLIGHRGPDSSGEWTSADGRYWLGNTRLAITLSTGFFARELLGDVSVGAGLDGAGAGAFIAANKLTRTQK